MKVAFERRGMGYVARYPEVMVEVAIDRLRSSSGELHGELTVEQARAGSTGHLLRAKYNLSSLTSRAATAKHLAARSKDVDWAEVMETFSLEVLKAEREGEPFEAVGQDEVRQQEPHLIWPLLPRNRPTIFFGSGGSGKSYLASDVAVGVACGVAPLPGCHAPSLQGNVVVLDWEADRYEWNDRLRECAKGLGVDIPPGSILYRACAGSFVDQVEQVARIVAEREAVLVIIDSVGMASPPGRDGGDPAESAMRLFQAIRLLGTTTLLIDHVTKDDRRRGGGTTPYGSVYKENLARSTWEVKKGAEEAGGVRHIALINQKVNRGPKHPMMALKVYHADDAVIYAAEEPAGELAEAQPLRTRIWNLLLDEGPMHTSDIALALDVQTTHVRVTLNRNPRDFKKLDDTRWSAVDEQA